MEIKTVKVGGKNYSVEYFYTDMGVIFITSIIRMHDKFTVWYGFPPTVSQRRDDPHDAMKKVVWRALAKELGKRRK